MSLNFVVCEKNLRVEMGYEQIITIMKKKFFEPSWASGAFTREEVLRD